MSQLPPDPHKGEGSNPNMFNEFNSISSDTANYLNNNYSTDIHRQSPASEPNNYQEQAFRRAGRQPRKMKEKKLSPRPSKLLSPDNQLSPSSSIPQIPISDNELVQMNQIPQVPYQMPMMPMQTQIGIPNSDNSANSVNMALQNGQQMRPVQPNMMQPVLYQNNKMPINQVNLTMIAALQNQLMNLDPESLDILLSLFEIPKKNFIKSQYIDSFISFMSNISCVMPQNFGDFIFFLLQQLTNKSASPIITQLLNPPIPVVFQQSIDKKIIYKFCPMYSKNIEIPPDSSIESEYAIISTIILSSPQTNGQPIIINGQQTHPVTFGENNDKNFYLISPMGKNRNATVNFNVRLNQKMIQSFCWMVFYYVVPAPMTQIERFSGIDPPIKGVRTDKCQENCLFNFYDVIHKIYSFGYSICPNCRQRIFLTKLIPIKQPLRPTSYLDGITSSFTCHYDSTLVEPYNYFSKDIDVSFINNLDINQGANNDDDNFDPDKYIEDGEELCYSITNNSFK